MTGARRRQVNARLIGLMSEAKVRTGLSSEELAARIGVTGRCIRQHRQNGDMCGLTAEQVLTVLELAGYDVSITWKG